MAQYTLTVVDTVGIQNYIFGSNNLKHNVGASELVYRVTHSWAYKALSEIGATNVDADGMFDERTIQGDALTSELVYAGGGNTVILFRSPEAATDFAKALTRKTLLESPGLQLVVAHTDFDWDNNDTPLAQVVQDTIKKASQKKNDRHHSAPLLGLGVTADCQFTGLPAAGTDQEGKRIAAEVQAKLATVDKANRRLRSLLPLDDFMPVENFDDFGTKGESSYIAVIHTDGNGMGKRVEAIAKSHPTAADNREYVTRMRAFSLSVKEAATYALKATITQLIEAIDRESGKIGDVVPVRNRKLPFRPIVFGGDDVTFVCDGRRGLTLTEFYLRQFTSHPLADNNQPIHARAGIAVVKTHYPFARAYALAEELVKSAKAYIKKRQTYSEPDLTAIDWHFAVSGLVLGLEEIRRREYTVRVGCLTMRPLRLGAATASDWHSWQTFSQMVNGFRGEDWAGKRNKIKALRDALRVGPEAVEQFLHLYGNLLPDVVTNTPNLAKTGWAGKECGYFDAIEALDFFVPLERSEQ